MSNGPNKKTRTPKAAPVSRPPTRREKAREATFAEIQAAARKLLKSGGSSAVTINAVGRELGMSGPALYHYVSSHEELVGVVTADFYRELAETMEAARDAHANVSPSRRMLATCRAMRSWALAHPAEFGWIFASPIEPPNRRVESSRYQAGDRFGRVFVEQVIELWETQPFTVPALGDLAPSLREQLRAYSAGIGKRLPPAAVHVMLSCWIRLYGLLCMEILHQLDFAYSDIEPVFEDCLRELSAKLGLEYTPPKAE